MAPDEVRFFSSLASCALRAPYALIIPKYKVLVFLGALYVGNFLIFALLSVLLICRFQRAYAELTL